jgi:Phytanoyl-CoA dioxygenase (PhyH)
MVDMSRDQIQQFDDLGFLVLREYIPPDLVSRLRSVVDCAINGALRLAKSASPSNEFCVKWVDDVPFVTYVDHLHRHASPASLELAGSPQMGSIGQAFCGDEYLVSYEYAVVKTSGDKERVPWHQDMIYDRTSRILNFGLYLSKATTSEGAVCVMPRTQHVPQDLCALESDAERERINIEMSPGDVLLHDVMLAHSSEGLVSEGQRVVLYFELRSSEHLQNNPRVSREWISARRDLREAGENAYRQSKPRENAPAVEGVAPASTSLQVIEDVYKCAAKREAARYCIPGRAALTDPQ